MTRIKYISLIVVLFFQLRGQSQNDSEHHFYAGINLLTPVGSVISGYYNDPLSYVSSNLNVSFYGEYRYSFLGIQIPVRLPITQLEVSDLNTTMDEYYYGGSYYLLWNTRYEIGIKPALYFNEFDEKFQVFGGIAYYIGSRNGFGEDIYSYFNFDPSSGEYDDFDRREYFPFRTEARSYTRTTLFSGAKMQFDNGLGISADCEIFFSDIRSRFGTKYTNYGTTDGEFYEDPYYYSYAEYKDVGVQFNFHLFYRFK